MAPVAAGSFDKKFVPKSGSLVESDVNNVTIEERFEEHPYLIKTNMGRESEVWNVKPQIIKMDNFSILTANDTDE